MKLTNAIRGKIENIMKYTVRDLFVDYLSGKTSELLLSLMNGT